MISEREQSTSSTPRAEEDALQHTTRIMRLAVQCERFTVPGRAIDHTIFANWSKRKPMSVRFSCGCSLLRGKWRCKQADCHLAPVKGRISLLSGYLARKNMRSQPRPPVAKTALYLGQIGERRSRAAYRRPGNRELTGKGPLRRHSHLLAGRANRPRGESGRPILSMATITLLGAQPCDGGSFRTSRARPSQTGRGMPALARCLPY